MRDKHRIGLIFMGLSAITLVAVNSPALVFKNGKTAAIDNNTSLVRTTTTTSPQLVNTTTEPETTTGRETTTAEPDRTIETETTPEPETTTEPPRETETTTTSEPGPTTEAEVVTEPTPEPASTPEPTPTSEPETVIEPTPEPESETVTVTAPEPAPAPTPEPDPTPNPVTPRPVYRPVPPPPAPIPTQTTTPEPEPQFPENNDGNYFTNLFGIENGQADDDMDGLSNNIEEEEKTDPFNPDTDGDQFTDSEEILDFKTNPLDPNDPGTLENLGIRVTSFEENQIVADPQPFIKGVAPLNAFLEISATKIDSPGESLETMVLGQTQTHENGIFSFVTAPLEDGIYTIMVREIKESDILDEIFIPAHAQNEGPLISEPITIIIDSKNEVTKPQPELLDDQKITEENLLRNLRLEVENNQPVLKGTATFQYKVIATWQSVVFSSALLADTPAGEFIMTPQRVFEPGDHEVYVQAVHPTTGAISEKVRIPFTIVHAEEMTAEPINTFPETIAITPELHEAPEDSSLQARIGRWITENPINAITLGIGAIAFLIVLIMAIRKTRSPMP